MIIKRIKVENFATYKNAELDFSRLGSTISVFGSTGAGKTTFFVDAITIALYGRAYGQLERKFARQVIPRWASRSRIEVDFEAYDGSMYRIIRILRKDKNPDVFLYKINEQGQIEKLIASQVTAVEREVIKLIGLDFTTFINTIVVRQGRVAELISRDLDRSERRKIFLKAFNIDFTPHKERARKLYHEARRELDKVIFEIERVKEEIQREPEVKSSIVQLELKLREVNDRIKKLQENKLGIEEQIDVLQDKKFEIERKLVELKGVYNLLEKCEGELQYVTSELSHLEEFVKKKDVLEKKCELLSQQLSFLEELFTLEQEANVITRNISHLEQMIVDRDSLVNRIEMTKKRISQLKEEISRLEVELKRYADLKNKLNSIEMEISRLEGYYGFIEDSISVLKDRMKAEIRCPVCNTPLTRERAEEAISHLNEEISRVKKRVDQLKMDRRSIIFEIESLGDVKEKLKQKEIELSSQTSDLKNLTERLEGVNSILAKISEEQIRLESIKSEFSKLSSRFSLLYGVVLRIGSVEDRLLKVKREYEELHRKLIEIGEASGKIEGLLNRKAELENQIKELKLKINEYPKIEELQSELEKLTLKLNSLSKKLEDVNLQLQSESRIKGSIEAQLNQYMTLLREISELKKKLSDLEVKRDELERKVEAYRFLYQSIFHEKGLPLMLLKTYIERVEEWADNYISKFLPGKSIRIEATEDAVSIIVYDEATIRDLTTYSGGETVLLGFAIRLGIAKALAERAGVVPRFLIIDEGFGPLSREFREELLKTLNELQRDYSYIVVISHVDEVRDSPYFESQVHIYKDENGLSHIEVLR